MRHLVLVSLLVLMVAFPTGCALSQSGSNTVAMLRKDAATELKQLTERSAETDSETESSSKVVQASFTKEADGDSAALPIDSADEPEQPEWWTAAETEPKPENQSFEKTTLSANSMTTVTTSNQNGSWKPKRGWTATKTR